MSAPSTSPGRPHRRRAINGAVLAGGVMVAAALAVHAYGLWGTAERPGPVLSDPFFAVSGEDGSYAIDRVPAGKYTVEAWHSQYGLLQKENVEVGQSGEVIVAFEYNDSMPEPAENKGELTGLW